MGRVIEEKIIFPIMGVILLVFYVAAVIATGIFGIKEPKILTKLNSIID